MKAFLAAVVAFCGIMSIAVGIALLIVEFT